MDEFDGCVFYDTYEKKFKGSGRVVQPTSSLSNGESLDTAAHGVSVDEVTQTVLAWEVDRNSHEPVWPAANLLCWFLCSDEGVRACLGRRVLEVGAGVGLTGLVASHFAKYVCMTDGDEEHLPLLRRNARENAPKCSYTRIEKGDTPVQRHVCSRTEEPAEGMRSGRIDVQHLWWGTEHALRAHEDPKCPLERHAFDTIIGSDIVYLREGVNALVETIAFFLNAENPTAAAYIMNVAHHMTNLTMLTDACVLHSLEVVLMPLDAFVPKDQLNEFPNAYMARIYRR